MTNEWDQTPWAGTAPPEVKSTALAPYRPRIISIEQKAVTGAGADSMAWKPQLDDYSSNPTGRMKAYLRAYKSNWFYKAESKISRDVSTLAVQLMPEDAEGDNQAAIVPPDLDIPFAALAPADQFLRLMERPNPKETGRVLRRKTQIRRDMAGAAFWFLEGGQGGALPTAIWGISPARMEPAYDRTGRLIGWVMDRDAPSGGVPFEPEEIVAFVNPGPGDGYDPVGVVESVWSQVPLTERLGVYTADLLSTGGRLSGMLTPKDRALDEAEFADVVRTWRSVTSDANAGRRLLIFPEPMEWTSGSATPSEIGIPELAALTRDEILTAFPISPYQLGVPMPGGLNSAETRREDRRDYWEGTIHPRVEDFEEDLQVQLVARYEQALGMTLDVEFIEPNLDDPETLVLKTTALQSLVAIGFDAEAAVEAVGLQGIKWNGLPSSLDPEEQARAQAEQRAASLAALQQANDQQGSEQAPPQEQDQTAPAERKSWFVTTDGEVKATSPRADAVGRELPGFDTRMRKFLREQQARLATNIRETIPQTKAGRMKAIPTDWWDAEAEDRALAVELRDPYGSLTRSAMQQVADDMGRVVTRPHLSRTLTRSLEAAGKRIHDINETTRKAVSDQLTEGVRRGYSIPQLIDGVPDEGFAGVKAAPMANGSPAFDELRAETIARTETMNAYNTASLAGYDTFGVTEVQAIDGDDDEECATRDGQTYPVAEALDILDHPNGTLDWVPVIDKAMHSSVQPITLVPTFNVTFPETKVYNEPQVVHVTPDIHVEQPVINVKTAPVTISVPEPVVHVTNELPETVVNVTSPDVHVAAPEVIVQAPDVHVTNEVPAPLVINEVQVPTVEVTTPEVIVNLPETQVTVNVPKPTKRTVQRDDKGQITGIVEE